MRSPAGVLDLGETGLSCQRLVARLPGYPAPELARAGLRTLSGNLRWLHCGPPRRASAPQEDSHPVSHSRLSRRATGPQPRPLTLSFSPRPRPAITRSRSSPSVISPQPASPSDPDSVTLSVACIWSCQRYDFSSAGSPQSRFRHFVMLRPVRVRLSSPVPL